MTSGFLANAAARLIVVFLLFFVFLTAGLVSGVGLHDPDTCWLLALGKYIFENYSLPATDPYSYTFALESPKVFVMYQWLSELIFYAAYKIGNLSGLLLLVAVILTASFISLPIFASRVIGTPSPFAVAATILMVLTACFHFLARPEIFSYLLLTLWVFTIVCAFRMSDLGLSLALKESDDGDKKLVEAGKTVEDEAQDEERIDRGKLAAAKGQDAQGDEAPVDRRKLAAAKGQDAQRDEAPVDRRKLAEAKEQDAQGDEALAAKGKTVEQGERKQKESPCDLDRLDWRAAAILGGLAIVWSNLHTGFVIGFVYLAVYCLVMVAMSLYCKTWSRTNISLLIALGICLCASLVNPYGLNLWTYVPQLFFSPINSRIVELRPLSLKDFAHHTYYPFVIASALAVYAWLRAFALAKRSLSFNRQLVFSAVALAVLIPLGFFCRRLIPFSGIMITFEGFLMLAVAHALGPVAVKSFWQRVHESMDDLFEPRNPMWFVTVGVLAAVGVYLIVSRVAPPVIPQKSVAFQPPFDAVKFLKREMPSGRVLNDPQFGDMLIFHLNDPPKLFIDTRFDMYGIKIVSDYETMVRCEPGWETLINKYDVRWVFLAPRAEIVKRLSTDAGWRQLYRDEAAVVMAR
ncbi:MAG TPA: hypothetical protein V6D17_22445 [Candidatus Obscuribacterales bacterium]